MSFASRRPSKIIGTSMMIVRSFPTTAPTDGLDSQTHGIRLRERNKGVAKGVQAPSYTTLTCARVAATSYGDPPQQVGKYYGSLRCWSRSRNPLHAAEVHLSSAEAVCAFAVLP